MELFADINEYMSDHTAQMRRELHYCDVVSRDESIIHFKKESLHRLVQMNELAKTISDVRRTSLDWFRKVHLPSKTIPQLHVAEISPTEFRHKFLKGNLPCLLRGLNDYQFAPLSSKWKAPNDTINRDWFIDMLGHDALVPVRQQSTGAIDNDGRAEECNTVEYSIQQWVEAQQEPNMYLKDWHLIKYLQDRCICETLYEVPDFFQRDLLNDFLTRVTGGDYKFVYWGPAGSQTPIHSDVLNSFSWSYNVVGTKKWIIYLPDEDVSIVVYQQVGECMFVPSGWRHEVMNLVETLSINHNWVTSANIDQLISCVLSEMKAVETECNAWGIHVNDFEARETMLRGCAGLNVTSCFFLVLSSLLDLVRRESCTSVDFENDSAVLKGTLQSLVQNDEQIGLQHRLSAVLASDALAKKALRLAEDFILK